MSVAAFRSYDAFPECECTQTAIRRRILSNGVSTFVLQCQTCGRALRSIKKDSPEVRQLADVQPFDTTLQEAWNDSRWRFYQAKQDAHANKETEWWKQYNAYLKTTAWRIKRQAVLTRANNWCEGCAARAAVEVHHKTYEHAFNEFLFELVAVCKDCHNRLHGHD